MNNPAFVTSALSARSLFQSSARSTSARRSLIPRFAAVPIFAALAFSSAFVPGVTASKCDASSDSGSCAAPTMATSLKDIKGLKAVDGTTIPDSTFDGKVVLAVNVASACGYTNSGYSMMKEIGTAYPNDVVVTAIPCNAFGRQENGSPEEIKAFAKAKYPEALITERSEVNGPSAHPIMALGLSKFPGEIGWNFDGVFVFDKEGKPSARFGNSAMAYEVKAAVDKLI